MAKQFDFEPEKALSATAYLAQRSGETMYTILKMIYVADRIHLERYGRPITGDNFHALSEGACPSKIYDSMKVLRGEKNHNYLPNSEKYLEVDPTTYDVIVKDMPSIDYLSASEIECLDETISILKRCGRWNMRDLAHDTAWRKTTRNAEMDFVDIAKSFNDNGEILAKHIETRFSL
jgi:uncharacterized phage-associated protein